MLPSEPKLPKWPVCLEFSLYVFSPVLVATQQTGKFKTAVQAAE